jgi:hypothetical protein
MKTSFAKRAALIVLPLVITVAGAWLLMRSLGTGSALDQAQTGGRKVLYYKCFSQSRCDNRTNYGLDHGVFGFFGLELTCSSQLMMSEWLPERLSISARSCLAEAAAWPCGNRLRKSRKTSAAFAGSFNEWI